MLKRPHVSIFGIALSMLRSVLAFSFFRSIRRANFFFCFSLRAISFCRFLTVSLPINAPFPGPQTQRGGYPRDRLFDTRIKLDRVCSIWTLGYQSLHRQSL